VQDRERIFEKFYRASEGDIHSTASGLGLGLAIARGIAESQGGSVWVEDGTDGFVTRFVFRMPIGDNQNGEPSRGDA
jgi:signal transduction histidine kinase